MFGKLAETAPRLPVLIQQPDQIEGELPAGLFNASELVIPSRPLATSRLIADRLLAWVSPAIHGHADEPLRQWMPQPYTPALLRANLTALYVELATSPWHTARKCFTGDLGACQLALGISGTDQVTDWFDATDRRHYVQQYLGRPDFYRECISGGDDVKCLAVMRLDPRATVYPPLSLTARQLLLAMAVDTGGPAAFDRMLAAGTQPLAARLAVASRLPIDSLVGRWRSRIVAARPQTIAADALAAWTAVAWGVLLIAAALRSSRWR